MRKKLFAKIFQTGVMKRQFGFVLQILYYVLSPSA